MSTRQSLLPEDVGSDLRATGATVTIDPDGGAVDYLDAAGQRQTARGDWLALATVLVRAGYVVSMTK